MATSVFLSFSSTQSSRLLRIGGAVINQNWAEASDAYVVPPNKRLILKGPAGITHAFQEGVHRTYISSRDVASDPFEATLVLTAGTILRQNTGSGATVVCTGFIEDDV